MHRDELVDGETLQERLRLGPIPIGEALSMAKQIAEALEGAHERGIIHRDLKPANTQINVVLNWFTELQQRVPVK